MYAWVAAGMALVGLACAPDSVSAGPRKREPWRAIHLGLTASGVPVLERAIETDLAPMGVNVIVVEVNYSFQFQSHPELRGPDPISKARARELADVCREHGIRLIPQLNCLGHQSWGTHTAPLLTQYPQFDETPDVPKDNKGIYCRSWCPLHPDVNPIVFALIDELIDAFRADAFHVGMDEVFLIGSDQCPRCRGKNPAELFAKAVNDLHKHLVGQRKVTMLMWGDRLLDDKTMGYGEWESSRNGTAPAIDAVPKDIIMCDWHYDKRDSYPSVRYFQEKGFRVCPAGWNKVDAVEALIDGSKPGATPKMLGYMATLWGVPADKVATYEPLRAAMRKLGAGDPQYWAKQQ